MIFGDTETTGLILPSANRLIHQPYIIEGYFCKTDKKLNFIEDLEFLLDPEVEIPEFITKITGISNDDIIGKPKFVNIYDRLCDFFLGETDFIAHNVEFDIGMLKIELQRIEKEFNFPWPRNHICTIEKTMHLENKMLKLEKLHEYATGKPHTNNAHRAKYDVFALIRCYKWIIKNNE